MTRAPRARRAPSPRVRLSRRGLLLLSYVAFVSLGLPDTVLGVAWPSVRGAFGRAQADLGAVLVASVAGYFAASAAAGRLASALGVGRLLAGSTAVVALGLAGYASAPAWAAFVPMAAVVGIGSGAIDAGINAYAARHFPVRHVTWLHGFWSLGATAGPLAMTAAVAAGSFRAGYAALALAIAALAIAFAITRSAWDDGTPAAPARPEPDAAAPAPDAAAPPPTAAEVLRHGATRLQIAIFFLYTGLEASVGAWCFTILREARGIGVEAAGTWTAAYWGSLMVARFALGAIVERVGPDRLLRLASSAAVASASAFALGDGLAGRLGLAALGASLAPFFPTLMARTPARLGAARAAHAVGFQVSAATLGAAALPSAAGVLAGALGAGAVAVAVAGAAVVLLALHELLVALARAPARA